MNESALILAAQQGSLDAFNHLVLAYQDSLFTTASCILGDDALAADATQEAFISAFGSIARFHGGSFRAWLLRIVTNACCDELRRQKRRRSVPLDFHDEDDISRTMADAGLLPEKVLENAELEAAICYSLNCLSANFRILIVLVDLQGMNYSEAAYATRVPLGTIKSRLARARLRFREHLWGFRDLLPTALFRKQKRFLVLTE